MTSIMSGVIVGGICSLISASAAARRTVSRSRGLDIVCPGVVDGEEEQLLGS
jgi:hypothetical protein